MKPSEICAGKKVSTPRTLPARPAGVLIALLAIIVLGGCSSSQYSRVAQQRLTRPDSLGRAGDFQTAAVALRGDQIKLRSPEYPEIDTSITVTEEGTITLRLGGTVAVMGLTRAELTAVLVARISPFVRTKFNLLVDIFNPVTQNVTVLGAVDRQGNFPMVVGSTILQALAAAGGATADADFRHIKIFRRGDPAYPIEIDLKEYLSSGEINAIPTLRPGDMMFVPKEENFVRELSSYLRDVIFLFSVFTIAR